MGKGGRHGNSKTEFKKFKKLKHKVKNIMKQIIKNNVN
jgi:hypothetical protein